MKIINLLFAFTFVLPAFAGKVLTYTASSTVSQEEANNEAIAGIAKQIVAEVQVHQSITKKESSEGGKSSLDETFFSSTKVGSNISIKGVTVTPIQAEGKSFKAKATLDLDEFTAEIQFHIKRIRDQIAKYESQARTSLKERNYGSCAKDIQAAKDLIPTYEALIEKLGKVYPLNDSHRLLHSLPEVESMLVAKLAGVKITGPTESFTLTKSEMPPWSVYVSDDQGALPNFPIVIRQGRNDLLEKRTDEKGFADVLLRKVNFEKGPYTIQIVPSIPLSIARAAGIQQGIEISYKVTQKRCDVHLECNEIANICNALETALSHKSIFLSDKSNVPHLKTSFNVFDRGSMTAGNATLNSYDVELSIKGGSIYFTSRSKGVGKNQLDATIKAVQKTNFSDLQKQLEKDCQ